MRRETTINLILFVGSILIVSGLHFDSWWHINIGRESPFTLPHNIIYFGMALVFLGAFIKLGSTIKKSGFREIKKNKKMLLLSIGILSAIFAVVWDNYFHEIYGIEDAKSIELFWNPAHLMLGISGAVTFYAIFQIIREDKKMRNIAFLSEFQFASVVGMLLIPLAPFDPTILFRFLFPFGVGILSFAASLLYVIGAVKAGGKFSFFKMSSFNWGLGIFVKPLLSIVVYPAFALLTEFLMKKSKMSLEKKSFTKISVVSVLFSLVHFPLINFLLNLNWSAADLAYMILSSASLGVMGAFAGYRIMNTIFSKKFL